MTALPEATMPYKRTGIFTEHTVPDGLLNDHETKPGVWGVITVIAGRLRFVVPSTGEDVVLTPDRPGIVAPAVPHRVAPDGPVEFFIQFRK